MATKTPPKPRNKPTPAAVISREELDAAEAEENAGLSPAYAEVYRDQALKLLLHPNGSAAMRWREFAAKKPTNTQLGEFLRELWTPPRSLDNPPCIASGLGSPMVWFGQNHVRGTPSLSGYELCEAVRRVLQMPDPEDAPAEEPRSFQQIKATGKSRAKVAKGPDKTPNMMDGVEVVEEKDIPYASIVRSKENPRTVFDQQMIADMEPVIETICKLNPLTIREGTNELIDGETRHRAGEKRKPALRCKIVRCTDAQAAAIRLASTVQRQDLNPIDRARAMRDLQERHGYSQAQVADLSKLKDKSSVSNYVRLLELPECWQQRVISGEIKGGPARDLVPWADEPKVLAEMDDTWKTLPEDERTSQTLKELLEDAIRELSDDLPRGMKFKEDQLKALRIRKIQWSWGGVSERCFNTELLQDLLAARDAKRQAKEQKRLEQSSTSTAAAPIDPKKAAENAKKQLEMFARKIYKFRVAWYQAMLVDQIADAADSDLVAMLMYLSCGHGNADRSRFLEKIVPLGKEKSTIKMHYHGVDPLQILSGLMKKSQQDERAIGGYLAKLIADQLSQKFDGFNNVVDPEEFELLAKHFDIDIKRDWTTSFDDGAACVKLWDQFCSLWNRDQILELLKEWKIPNTAGESAKRSDLVKLLRTDKGCPKAIINAEVVRLS